MLWWVVQNLVITGVLAAAVVLACRTFRPCPALRHALWLLVLIKLVTPPLVTWPWALPMGSLVAEQPEAIDVSVPAKAADASDVIEPPAKVVRNRDVSANPETYIVKSEWHLAHAPAPAQGGPPVVLKATPEHRRSSMFSGGVEPLDAPSGSVMPSPSPSPKTGLTSRTVVELAGWSWLAGSLFVAFFHSVRIFQLRRLVASGQLAEGWLSDESPVWQVS